ncbi:hypothetical protein FB45DRAFT_1053199 [Roridomyces roridus]|uniref:Uncharacterized protein n=1 Tax=Roridomyces roridus TaxID=1738132 RepID=A0AAD7CBN2_9AGAR|nr:hypothetical protein FB45DRAFT_1053199 [Roridomyces roridus]
MLVSVCLNLADVDLVERTILRPSYSNTVLPAPESLGESWNHTYFWAPCPGDESCCSSSSWPPPPMIPSTLREFRIFAPGFRHLAAYALEASEYEEEDEEEHGSQDQVAKLQAELEAALLRCLTRISRRMMTDAPFPTMKSTTMSISLTWLLNIQTSKTLKYRRMRRRCIRCRNRLRPRIRCER